MGGGGGECLSPLPVLGLVRSSQRCVGVGMASWVLPLPLCSPQTAYTTTILAFVFVCHPEVLPIYTELHRSAQGGLNTWVL